MTRALSGVEQLESEQSAALLALEPLEQDE
jgi:hypothetical protein